MKFLLTLVFAFLLVGNVAGACNDCECPDFMSLRSVDEGDPDMFYTQHAGCSANVTSPPKHEVEIKSFWNDTEIAIAERANRDVRFLATTNGITEESVELFSYFGIVCENKSWYMTQYPKGIQYMATNGVGYRPGFKAEYQGKKSKIYGFVCFPQ